MNNFFQKNPILIFIIFSIVIIVFFRTFIDSDGLGFNQTKITKNVIYSDIKKYIKSNKIHSVKITRDKIEAISINGHIKYVAQNIPAFDEQLIPLLEANNISYEGEIGESLFSKIFNMIFPILLFFGIWFLIVKKMSKGMGGGILNVGKSNKLIDFEKPKTRFDDVQGVEEAKDEVKEIVDFLKYPEKYINLGAKIPKGLLLVGPPGTGKTLLAKAVAGEASVPFFSVSGSSFIEMFVGVGASRVRDLFEKAKKDAPSIIFIDEIDAIGKSRASGANMGGNDEREQTLNQLLSEMDGFGNDVPVIILAATNRPEVLDPALLRAGRFDRQVLVDKPDYRGRLDILEVHSKDVKLSKDVDLKKIAKQTSGLAGADLANIINESALLAGRLDKKEVEQPQLNEAIERSFVGLEKKNKKVRDIEKKIVAYHESGHALIAELTEGATEVTKVSIVPRGLSALGYTLHLPEEDIFLKQKFELVAEVLVLLGGRAAEEIFLKEISTGASNDLDRATTILRDMISIYGMSDVAGLMVLEKRQNSFLGGQSIKDYSEETATNIDKFIKNNLYEYYNKVKNILEANRDIIENMVVILLDTEVLEGSKVREIIDNHKNINFDKLKKDKILKDFKK